MNKFASGTFFVCVYVFFLNKRYIFSNTFALCGQVGDKKNFTRPIPETKLLFWPNFKYKMQKLQIPQKVV